MAHADPKRLVLGNMNPNASTVAYDFLALLLTALNQRGLQYTVAAQSQTSDIEMPFYTGASPIPFSDLRWIDSEVILVRSDVNVLSSHVQVYDSAATWNVGGLTIAEKRSWTAATVEIGRRQLTFVNTHLLGQSNEPQQLGQTEQLIEWLNDVDDAVILVGDFNSAANPSAPEIAKTPTYGMLLNAGYADLWDRGNKPNSGLTCCDADLLKNTPLNFAERLDLILLNQQMGRLVGAAQMQVVGDDISPRNIYGIWPADHAAVFAVLHMPM